ncbi:lysylphosphatidylglycerol synthase transmembrane domain-containing protein [Actinoplanes sp. CA-131856]
MTLRARRPGPPRRRTSRPSPRACARRSRRFSLRPRRFSLRPAASRLRPAALRLAPAALRLAPVVFPFAPAALLYAPGAFRPASNRPRPPSASPPPQPKSRRRPTLRILLWAAAAAAVVIALRGRIPDPSSVVTTLTHADPRWLAVAVVAQLLSQAGFALQQRTLLTALGTRLPVPDALAITFSRTAMGSVLPAGSAMSAAFALQQFRRRGAHVTAATTAVVLSATASVLGLAVLYAATATLHLAPSHTAELAAALILLTITAAVLTRTRRRAPLPATPHPPHSQATAPPPSPAPAAGLPSALGPSSPPSALGSAADSLALPSRPAGSSVSVMGEWRGLSAARRNLMVLARRWLGRAVAQSRRMVGEAKAVRPRHWLVALGYAALNWTLDLACLVAVAQACDFPLSTLQLTSVYMAVQIVRQIPITPGGIGLIEASLLAGFLAAGAPEAAAAAVVLGYRIVSFWLLLPIGLATYLRLGRAPSRA